MTSKLPSTIAILAAVLLVSAALSAGAGRSQASTASDRDETVRNFLQSMRGRWHDMNVGSADGKILHDLIVEHGYTRALEIGTSTGHSGIWIAWALSKTGGKLITVEIDEDRHAAAVENFRRAGLSAFVDARLADAHELVPRLPGPFDFVFCDADKDWYPDYFKAVWPKVIPGGCYTAHNVTGWMSGIREFLDYARGLADAETSIDRTTGSGISMTYKKPAK